MKNTWKTQLKILWKGWGVSLLVALIVATSFKSAVADWNIVPTGSMKPTILEGDRLFINKLSYDLKIPYTTLHVAEWGAPRRGDVVVFFSPTDGKRLVKRVVGVPGDTLAMHNNQLIINGRPLSYVPMDASAGSDAAAMEAGQFEFSERLGDAAHPVMVTPRRPALRSFGPIRVPAGRFFMMGDNRDNSADSRYFGFVDRSRIVGRASAVVISLDINDRYRPRWDRFFSALP